MADEIENQEQGAPEYTVKIADNETPNNWLNEVENQEEEKVEEIANAETESHEEVKEEAQEQAQPNVELDDDRVLEYLRTKGLTAQSFDDLKPKEQRKLTAEAEEFAQFQEKTNGRGMADFLETRKDWSAENQDSVLKKLLREENPTLDQDEIDFLFKEKYSYDADDDEDSFIMKQKINTKSDYQRALKLLEEQKASYSTPRGAEEFVPQEYREAFDLVERLKAGQKENEVLGAEIQQDYIKNTESVFQNFEGFKFKVGDEEFVYKPSDVESAKKEHSDINNFNKKFFDDKGKLTDPVGFHKAFAVAMNADKFAEHFINLGMAKQVEADEKASKNITIPGMQKIAPTPSSKITVKVV